MCSFLLVVYMNRPCILLSLQECIPQWRSRNWTEMVTLDLTLMTLHKHRLTLNSLIHWQPVINLQVSLRTSNKEAVFLLRLISCLSAWSGRILFAFYYSRHCVRSSSWQRLVVNFIHCTLTSVTDLHYSVSTNKHKLVNRTQNVKHTQDRLTKLLTTLTTFLSFWQQYRHTKGRKILKR